MKANNNVEQQTPVKQTEWVVNCNKCGASLTVKSNKSAYICPVCGTLFRVQTGTRMVKDVSDKEKQVCVVVTENTGNATKVQSTKKLSKRAEKRARKKLAKALKTVVAQNVKLGNCQEGEVSFVNADGKGVCVKKS